MLLRCDLASQVAKMQALLWPKRRERERAERGKKEGKRLGYTGGQLSLLTEAGNISSGETKLT